MAKVKARRKNTSLDTPRSWWLKGYQDYRFVMEQLMNIGYHMVDNPSTDSKDSFITGPPQFTMIQNGHLMHYQLERADVDEHYEEMEESIWSLKNEQD